MKLKTLIIAIVVLGVLSVGAYFFTRPEAPKAADSRLGQPLVANAMVEKAAKLRITDAGKTVELTLKFEKTGEQTVTAEIRSGEDEGMQMQHN